MSTWQEIRDSRRLWCRIDPERCLIEIVHRGEVKVIDLIEYGLRAPESAKEIDDERHETILVETIT